MKLLVINGNGYSGAWFFLSEQGFLSGALHKITKEKPDLEYLYFDAAELERIWRMDANGDYNIWSELEDNA